MNKINDQYSPRVVVITGARSGIGYALAEQLNAAGNRVYALSRGLKDNLTEKDEIQTLTLDVTDDQASRDVIRRIIEKEAHIDILILAAGYGLAGAVEALSSNAISDQMATNFLGACHLLSPVLEHMRKQESGLIVQIGSVAAFMPLPFQACYSASKAAVSALVQAVANEVKPYGIRCMIVQPGDTQTGFTEARQIDKITEALPYGERFHRSIARMTRDEQQGITADKLACMIIRRINRKKPPLIYIPGAFYKTAALFNRILPVRWINAILYGLYGR